MFQNVQYSNGPPSQVTTIWILDTHTVRYLDESCIQVFGIQMFTVLCGGEKRGFDLKLTLNPDVECFCASHNVLSSIVLDFLNPTLHLKNDAFSISLLFPLHQGNTLSLPNVRYLSSYFTNCIQKVVTSVRHSWELGLKKPTLYYLLFVEYVRGMQYKCCTLQPFYEVVSESHCTLRHFT